MKKARFATGNFKNQSTARSKCARKLSILDLLAGCSSQQTKTYTKWSPFFEFTVNGHVPPRKSADEARSSKKSWKLANGETVLNIRHRRGTLQLATSLEGLKKVTVRQRAETLKTSYRLLFAKKETGTPSRNVKEGPFWGLQLAMGHGPHKKSEDFRVRTRKGNPRSSALYFYSLPLEGETLQIPTDHQKASLATRNFVS